MIEAVARR